MKTTIEPILISKREDKAEAQISHIRRSEQVANSKLKYWNNELSKYFDPITTSEEAIPFAKSAWPYFTRKLQEEYSQNKRVKDSLESIFSRYPDLNQKTIHYHITPPVRNLDSLCFKNGQFSIKEGEEERIRKSFEIWATKEYEIELIHRIERLCKEINDHRAFLKIENSHFEMNPVANTWGIKIVNDRGNFSFEPDNEMIVVWMLGHNTTNIRELIRAERGIV